MVSMSAFSNRPAAELFHTGLGQREALARLRFLRHQGRRLGLVAGPPGVGKSLLLEVFGGECRRQGDTVVQLDVGALSTHEFFWQLGNAFEASASPAADTWQLFRQLTDRLYENRLQSKRTILLCDHVDQARADLQTQLSRLVRLDPVEELTVVLTADLAGAGRLPAPLREAIELHVDLPAWDELDTVGYLQTVLAGSDWPVFTDQALSKLHQLAEGVPRTINRLADYALWVGSQQSAQRVGPEMVQAAHQALLPREWLRRE